jgi:hypothetical protein
MLYAVTKRDGRWTINIKGVSIVECDSYQEALEIVIAAVDILTQRPVPRGAEKILSSEDQPD